MTHDSPPQTLFQPSPHPCLLQRVNSTVVSIPELPNMKDPISVMTSSPAGTVVVNTCMSWPDIVHSCPPVECSLVLAKGGLYQRKPDPTVDSRKRSSMSATTTRAGLVDVFEYVLSVVVRTWVCLMLGVFYKRCGFCNCSKIYNYVLIGHGEPLG